MPAEIPPRRDGNNSLGASPDRGSMPPRLSMDQLRERAKGGNVHPLIGLVLQNDAKRAFAFFRGDPASGFPSLDPEMMSLYDIHSGTEIDIRFLDGFSYVANQLYPSVVDAALKISGRKPLFPSGVVESTMSASEAERKRFVEEIARNPQLRERVSGSVIESLEADSSGVTWLEIRALEEFGPDALESNGVRHAIAGARKLYEELSQK